MALTGAAGALNQGVNWGFQDSTSPRSVEQRYQFILIDHAHRLHLLDDALHQVGRFRQLTYGWPQFCPQGDLLLGCKRFVVVTVTNHAPSLGSLSYNLSSDIAPCLGQRALAAKAVAKSTDDRSHHTIS